MDYFGIREVCEVTLRSLRNIPACRSMTGKDIKKGEPVMYFDYLKVSNISGSVTTVYANGGRGNTRRLSWDGDKEITFHIEDALISPTSMAILTAAQMIRRRITRVNVDMAGVTFGGVSPAPDALYDPSTNSNTIILTSASGFDPVSFVDWAIIEVDYDEYDSSTLLPTGSTGTKRINSKDIELIKQTVDGVTTYNLIIDTIPGEITSITTFQMLIATAGKPVYKHEKYTLTASVDGELQINHTPMRDVNHPLFIFDVHDDGSIDLISDIQAGTGVTLGTGAIGIDIPNKKLIHPDIYAGNDYLVDYYREVKGNVTSLIITADGTSDYYKLEGETLMRREADGMDIPVVITIPKVRPRAQFEIPMSSTGDPATFAFDFDVFPARDSNYTKCNDNVMVIIDIIEDDAEDCNCVVEELEIWKGLNPTP